MAQASRDLLNKVKSFSLTFAKEERTTARLIIEFNTIEDAKAAVEQLLGETTEHANG